ncbi:hypothetical protein FHS95_001278 [Sphingomonas naasensis]|uniref:Uncharacterized protein n=2 Tax=Sphingomonas naasensis TaxID=1344951 RepID=A0A4S1W4W2_9SPHN|nr:hypothetical protein [Sphingomonas naasensis]NIJ19609.1 hypothetical protein [Sphingomonas naasensis]TGX37313.1 hypothetical protein E5A74_20435 [Sphingomonas naasensis]
MLVPRIVSILAVAAACLLAAPASAQFFIKPANLAGARVTGAEPGMTGPALPNASPAELRAALVWNLRAALNVAALQCQFEPTLLTVDNYNALLKDHEVELRESYGTLEKYFIRANSTKKAGQTELDKFGTRVYSGFSTVSGQLSFCQTAAAIGHEALFRKRGDFGDLAEERMRELRSSLNSWGEQFRRSIDYRGLIVAEPLPPFGNDKCWRKGEYQPKKCGVLRVATR